MFYQKPDYIITNYWEKWKRFKAENQIPSGFSSLLFSINGASSLYSKDFLSSCADRKTFFFNVLQKYRDRKYQSEKGFISALKFMLYQYKKSLKLNLEYLDFWSSKYPEKLRRIYDPPLYIFYSGNYNLLTKNGWSIVGTRHPSPISVLACNELISDMPRENAVISGLAVGIDRVAHRCALMEQQGNIGVLGSGLDRPYPPENRKLFYTMRDNPDTNLLISEFPLESPPQAFHFPRRNRLISALSSEVFIMEAPLNSGALITMDFALEMGIEPYIFYHPGQWNNLGGRRHLRKGEAHLLNWEQISSKRIFHSSELQSKFKISGEKLRKFSYFFRNSAPNIRKCGESSDLNINLIPIGANYYLLDSDINI